MSTWKFQTPVLQNSLTCHFQLCPHPLSHSCIIPSSGSLSPVQTVGWFHFSLLQPPRHLCSKEFMLYHSSLQLKVILPCLEISCYNKRCGIWWHLGSRCWQPWAKAQPWRQPWTPPLCGQDKKNYVCRGSFISSCTEPSPENRIKKWS